MCVDIVVVTQRSLGLSVPLEGGWLFKQSTSWVSVDRGHCVNESDVSAGLCALC